MGTIRVVTAYGTAYEFDEETGDVTRYGEHRWALPHPSWRITGAVVLSGTDRPTRRLVTLRELAEWADRTLANSDLPPLLFKNGAPRYTLTDLDHGVPRMHGNTRAHGIRHLYRVT